DSNNESSSSGGMWGAVKGFFSGGSSAEQKSDHMSSLETPDIPHTRALQEGAMQIGDAELEYARMINSIGALNQRGGTVIAPSTTSIQNNNLNTSSGARNTDPSLGRMRMRQYN